MTDSLILYELQKIHKAATETKEEHKLNFRMVMLADRFNVSEPLLNTKKLGLFRLSVLNSLLFTTITPGAYELSGIAGIMKEEK